MKKTHQLGIQGEDLVVRYLEERGCTIRARNFSSKTGEIDIVAGTSELLMFVEVKTRSSSYFHTSHVITHNKQRRIISTAKYYLVLNNITDRACRFDVALVDGSTETIEYISNAFYGQ